MIRIKQAFNEHLIVLSIAVNRIVTKIQSKKNINYIDMH